MFNARKQLYLGATLGREFWRIDRNGRSGRHKREEKRATLLLAFWAFLYNALRR